MLRQKESIEYVHLSENIPGNDVESSPWQLKYQGLGLKKIELTLLELDSTILVLSSIFQKFSEQLFFTAYVVDSFCRKVFISDFSAISYYFLVLDPYINRSSSEIMFVCLFLVPSVYSAVPRSIFILLNGYENPNIEPTFFRARLVKSPQTRLGSTF